MRVKEKVNRKPLTDLRKQRKYLSLTQQQVADRAGISMYTYSQIERGYVNIESVRIETLRKIISVLYSEVQ